MTRQGNALQLEKRIELLQWDEAVRRKAATYWANRRMRIDPWGEDGLLGRRGSLWGNFTALDMRRLRTELLVSRSGALHIACRLTVDTRLQVITPWNEAFWRLELDTFESYMRCDDLRERDWSHFLFECRKADQLWLASFGTRQYDMSRTLQRLGYERE